MTAVDLNIGISAYLITLAVLIPASGWIADRFGARKIFTLALAIFTLASVFCGLSTNVDVFVAMRILQGDRRRADGARWPAGGTTYHAEGTS
ncbi:major facilitator superfamily permease [Klebsiella michiganensis]|uniref:Major facilitator superfamily permease n=1 Tax=Klebsiella michiganensis TaxID=1134687 RepID=A0A7H4PK05_9ENTR|nr:major facilitator superfamily permease [Klebsiella michiganensis]